MLLVRSLGHTLVLKLNHNQKISQLQINKNGCEVVILEMAVLPSQIQSQENFWLQKMKLVLLLKVIIRENISFMRPIL